MQILPPPLAGPPLAGALALPPPQGRVPACTGAKMRSRRHARANGSPPFPKAESSGVFGQSPAQPFSHHSLFPSSPDAAVIYFETLPLPPVARPRRQPERASNGQIDQRPRPGERRADRQNRGPHARRPAVARRRQPTADGCWMACQLVKQTDRQASRQTGKQANRRAGGQAGRQAEKSVDERNLSLPDPAANGCFRPYQSVSVLLIPPRQGTRRTWRAGGPKLDTQRLDRAAVSRVPLLPAILAHINPYRSAIPRLRTRVLFLDSKPAYRRQIALFPERAGRWKRSGAAHRQSMASVVGRHVCRSRCKKV